jgi:hypothetical protein
MGLEINSADWLVKGWRWLGYKEMDVEVFPTGHLQIVYHKSPHSFTKWLFKSGLLQIQSRFSAGGTFDLILKALGSAA